MANEGGKQDSLYTFYELLFPKFTAIKSDGEVIINKFSNVI